MSASATLTALTNPPVLYFGLGLVAAKVRSDLEIPAPLSAFFGSFLLMAIGFRGGAELGRALGSTELWLTLLAAALLSTLAPLYLSAVARRRFDPANAAALAAAYGSVSAVTFACALALLQSLAIPYHEYMNVALAAMEAPAILTGAAIYRYVSAREEAGSGIRHDARPGIVRLIASKGSLLLLVGSLAIGLVAGDAGWTNVKPVFGDLFKGILCFFLLDQGCRCGRQLGDLAVAGLYALGYAVLMPLVGAALGLAAGHLLGLRQGDAFLLTVLAASASYLAVPAAMREVIPKANPGVYVTLPLAVTFPFNVVLGLPLYLALAGALAALGAGP